MYNPYLKFVSDQGTPFIEYVMVYSLIAVIAQTRHGGHP